MKTKIVFNLKKDKDTKNAVRFKDEDGYMLYLPKEKLAEIGNPENIKMMVKPA